MMKNFLLPLLLLAPSIVSPMHPAVRLLMAGTGGAAVGYAEHQAFEKFNYDRTKVYPTIGAATIANVAIYTMLARRARPLESIALVFTSVGSNLATLVAQGSDKPEWSHILSNSNRPEQS